MSCPVRTPMDGAAPRVGSRRPAPVSHRHDGDPAHRFTPLVPTIPPLTPPRRTASFARRAPAPTGNGQSASTPPVLRQRRSAAFRACEQTVPCSWREFDPVLARMRNFGAAGKSQDAHLPSGPVRPGADGRSGPATSPPPRAAPRAMFEPYPRRTRRRRNGRAQPAGAFCDGSAPRPPRHLRRRGPGIGPRTCPPGPPEPGPGPARDKQTS